MAKPTSFRLTDDNETFVTERAKKEAGENKTKWLNAVLDLLRAGKLVNSDIVAAAQSLEDIKREKAKIELDIQKLKKAQLEQKTGVKAEPAEPKPAPPAPRQTAPAPANKNVKPCKYCKEPVYWVNLGTNADPKWRPFNPDDDSEHIPTCGKARQPKKEEKEDGGISVKCSDCGEGFSSFCYDSTTIDSLIVQLTKHTKQAHGRELVTDAERGEFDRAQKELAEKIGAPAA